jgi:uncharacterized membrane protein
VKFSSLFAWWTRTGNGFGPFLNWANIVALTFAAIHWSRPRAIRAWHWTTATASTAVGAVVAWHYQRLIRKVFASMDPKTAITVVLVLCIAFYVRARAADDDWPHFGSNITPPKPA